MVTGIVRKAFDIYTTPARFALSQGRKNLQKVRELGGELRQFQLELTALTDELVAEAATALNIDTTKMSKEERELEAQLAISRAEQGLSIAFQELLKALILIKGDSKPGIARRKSGDVLEGTCERVGD